MYSITFPVAPVDVIPIDKYANIVRAETSAGYDGNVIQSDTLMRLHFDFTLLPSTFYDTLVDWFSDNVIGADQLWAYVDYEPLSLDNYPMIIKNDAMSIEWYVKMVYFRTSLDLQTKLLRRGEGDSG